MISMSLKFMTRNEMNYYFQRSKPAAWFLQSSRPYTIQSYEKHSNPILDVNIPPPSSPPHSLFIQT